MPPRAPGRPPGRSQKGDAREAHLYETALRLFAEQGYAETTLRQIARAAEVSPGLLYRYFEGKEAVLLRLYTELSTRYAARTGVAGQPWSRGVVAALENSLEVLGPHRKLLQSLMGTLVGPGDNGLFSESTKAARLRVMEAFAHAVGTASDAPGETVRGPLARLCYLGHLAVILFWLLDRSAGQSATARLVEGTRTLLPRAGWLLRLPGAGRGLIAFDAVVWSGLLGESTAVVSGTAPQP